MAYGYRIYRVFITPYRKLQPQYQLDDPVFGQGGASAVLQAAASALVAKSGATDSKKSHYFRCDEALQDGWVLALATSGGEYGTEREVVDAQTHQPKPAITKTDVVMSPTRFLMALPTTGDSAILVSLVDGRSHGTPGLMSALNKELEPKGFTLRLEWNLADSVAWNNYLERSDVDVTGVDLIEHHPAGVDGSSFTKSGVVKATVGLKLAQGSSLRQQVLARLKKAREKNEKPDLADVVGIDLPDVDFDQERVVYVTDGRERRLSVTDDYPVFIYSLGEYDELPPLVDFLNTAHDDVSHLFDELGISRPGGWWMAVPDAQAL